MVIATFRILIDSTLSTITISDKDDDNAHLFERQERFCTDIDDDDYRFFKSLKDAVEHVTYYIADTVHEQLITIKIPVADTGEVPGVTDDGKFTIEHDARFGEQQYALSYYDSDDKSGDDFDTVDFFDSPSDAVKELLSVLNDAAHAAQRIH